MAFAAESYFSMSLRSASTLASALRASGSSSTIKTRISISLRSLRVRRQDHRGFAVPGLKGWEVQSRRPDTVDPYYKTESRIVGIQIPEPGSRVWQSHSQARLTLPADTVLNLQMNLLSPDQCANAQPASRSRRSDPVQNRVLHQRLQNQLRHQDLPRFRLYVPLDAQAFLQPHFFQIQIRLQEFQL